MRDFLFIDLGRLKSGWNEFLRPGVSHRLEPGPAVGGPERTHSRSAGLLERSQNGDYIPVAWIRREKSGGRVRQ